MIGPMVPPSAAARLDERDWPYSSSTFRAIEFRFVLRSMNVDLGEYLESVLEPLATAEAPPAHVYSLVDYGERNQRRFAIYCDGKRIVRTGVPSMAVSYLLWHVNQCAVRHSGRYLLLHSSGAALRGHGLIFPAPMESGKTTLVAGLLQRGFEYITDETVAIDPETLLLHPYPKALGVDAGSWPVLPELEPALTSRFARFVSGQWHVNPLRIRASRIADPCPARLVISPRYAAGSRTALTRVSRAAAVLLLAENAFNFGVHGAAGLDTLARMVRGCECYTLTVGSLPEACEVILNLANESLSP